MRAFSRPRPSPLTVDRWAAGLLTAAAQLEIWLGHADHRAVAAFVALAATASVAIRRRHPTLVGMVVPTLYALLGHETNAMGAGPQRDAEHLFSGGHLEIEIDGEMLLERCDIGVDDMAAILAQMHGDLVRSARDAFARGREQVRIWRVTQAAQRGHVVDVDAESCRLHRPMPWCADAVGR